MLTPSCGLLDSPPPLQTPAPSLANIIANPGFEIYGAPWIAGGSPPPALTVPPNSPDRPHGGNVSLDLKLVSGGEDMPFVATTVAQRLNATVFPEFVSGFYRVDAWEPHADFQYLYFAVAVDGGDFGDGRTRHEIRFLVGAPSEPALEPDVRYIFLSRSSPVLQRWTYVSYPVRAAFEQRFGGAPSSWEGIEISVGVRSDRPRRGEPSSFARVFFDDMYAGSQADNPNRPDD